MRTVHTKLFLRADHGLVSIERWLRSELPAPSSLLKITYTRLHARVIFLS